MNEYSLAKVQLFYKIKEYFCTIKAWKYGNKIDTKLSFFHISATWSTRDRLLYDGRGLYLSFLLCLCHTPVPAS